MNWVQPTGHQCSALPCFMGFIPNKQKSCTFYHPPETRDSDWPNVRHMHTRSSLHLSERKVPRNTDNTLFNSLTPNYFGSGIISIWQRIRCTISQKIEFVKFNSQNKEMQRLDTIEGTLWSYFENSIYELFEGKYPYRILK